MTTAPPGDTAPSVWSEADCYAALRRLRWASGVACPFCGTARITPHTVRATAPRRRYLCLACRRTFSDLTGTPFARTNLPLNCWFLYLRARGSGLRLSEVANALGVKSDTAAFMERRVARAEAAVPWVRCLQEAIMRSMRHA